MLAALVAIGFVSYVSAAEERPNIVVFLIDDMGRHDCGFMGGTEIKTPHIDRLAKAGTTLDAFYVQPVCSPTCAALMTGRYPMRHGLQTGVVRPWAQYGLPLTERTLPSALHDAGYATAITGKWHLGHFAPEYLPTRRGFDHQYGHYNGALDYFTHIRDGGFDWHKDDRVNRDEGYSTHLVAAEAAKFVTENAGKKPYFLYVPFNGVHSPHQVPAKYLEPYGALKGDRKLYAGMLAAVDEAIGQVVTAVEKSGTREKTLFIFSSDNGGPAPGRVTDNGKYRAGKGTVYEGGVRVAAFATWDGHLPAGKTLEEPLHIVDLYPTLLKLAGAKSEQSTALDGRDAWATLSAGKPSPHDAILLNVTPNGGAIRAGDWKLVAKTGEDDPDGEEDAPAAGKTKGKGNGAKQAPANGGIELYDLKSDPYEKTNLAEKQPERVKDLRAKLDAYAKEAVPPKAKPKPKDFVTPKVWGE
ncbi:MAG: arylsulfatase [Pirellulales bacterium]